MPSFYNYDSLDPTIEDTDLSNEEFMLSTIDNPYDPFSDYESWYAYDSGRGYNSNAYLARIALLSEDLSISEQKAEVQRAIDEILFYDTLGIYMKVRRGQFDNSPVKLSAPFTVEK